MHQLSSFESIHKTNYVAHEVNKAMTALLINAESALRWLERDSVDLDRAKHSIGMVISNGQRVGHIVGRIREATPRLCPELEAVDINAIATDTLTLMSLEISREDIVVDTELCAGLSAINGDRMQLEQVFVNLIANSIESMSSVHDRQRLLRIGTYPVDQGQVLVAIEDNGVGIPPEDAENIFDYLFTTKPQGMGIGLSISRSIIASHGGRIWATRNRSHGSTFRLILPSSSHQPSR